ncbi:acyl carrier protein-like protein [Globomyces pollinis-pini]|nr:acyl carrier protein-like protein [Globomyces pollinis-pini]
MKFVRAFSGHPEHPSLQQVEDRVLALLKDFDKVDHTKLSLDAHFVNDLGLDSLDQVEITMALEDEFNIELADRDADDIFTPRQAVEKVSFFFLF